MGSLKAFLVEQHARHPELSRTNIDEFLARFITLDRRGQTRKSVVFQQILSDLLIHSDNLAAKLIDEYTRGFSQFARGFDGLDNLFIHLRDKHLRIGIVTNGETEFQMRSIHALGLENRVNAILISESEGVRKPERTVFLRAAARLGLVPAECLFVGDNPRVDILGAHSAGLSTIWFSDGVGWPTGLLENPGPTIHNLRSVLDVLDR